MQVGDGAKASEPKTGNVANLRFARQVPARRPPRGGAAYPTNVAS